MWAASGCAPFDLFKLLYDIGGKDLIMYQKVIGRPTVLHWACQGNDPNLDVVKFLVEKGGRELLMMQGNRRFTALDKVTDKKGVIYKYLIDAHDFPFHAHCSTSYVTVSTIQQYINKHGTDCLFQTNTTHMTPLHIIAINPSAQPGVIQRIIEQMIENKTRDTRAFDLMMPIVQDTAVTDNAAGLSLYFLAYPPHC